jgi:hypothetical protein
MSEKEEITNDNIYLDWLSIEKRKKWIKTRNQPLHYILLTKDLAKYKNPNYMYFEKINKRNRIIDLSSQPRIILLQKICMEIDYNLDIIKNIYQYNASNKERMNDKIKKKNQIIQNNQKINNDNINDILLEKDVYLIL